MTRILQTTVTVKVWGKCFFEFHHATSQLCSLRNHVFLFITDSSSSEDTSEESPESSEDSSDEDRKKKRFVNKFVSTLQTSNRNFLPIAVMMKSLESNPSLSVQNMAGCICHPSHSQFVEFSLIFGNV